MQKLKEIGIISLLILITACSGAGKLKRSDRPVANTEAALNSLYSEVERNNIGERGYIIKNGNGYASGMGFASDFNFNLRKNSKGDFSISIRGPFAIEVVRLVSVNNDIYVINRLEKKIYKGSKSSLSEKFGVPENIIELLLGDITTDGKRIQFNMNEEVAIVKMESADYALDIFIDRGQKKIIKESVKSNSDGNEVELTFSKFRTEENFKFPGEVSIKEKLKGLNILLNIENLKAGFSEEIDLQLPDYKIVNL